MTALTLLEHVIPPSTPACAFGNIMSYPGVSWETFPKLEGRGSL